MLDKILECELEYVKCFCEVDERQDIIRLRDDLIPDMWYHNYTRIKNAKDDTELIRIIKEEISYNKNIGRNFCLLRCHVSVDQSILVQLSCKPEISAAGYYVFDISKLSRLTQTKDSSVVRVENDKMIEDILMLDLEHDEEDLGIDFCTRRVYRRKAIYLADEGVDSYICYHDGRAVGNCNLFIYNDAAKIEDFAVLPHYQRKGFGTAILQTLINIALDKNVSLIYLETDEDDSAKEMFQKCGFYKVDEFTDLSFELD